jgi:DNA-binding transcriptional regulator LsrR (DeoR family)
MKRQEVVLRRIACGYISGERSFTQLGISKELGVSLSAVNGAVSNLRDINAVRVKRRSFEVTALDRLLLYWATHRNLKKDITYQTRADMPVKDIEKSMPDGAAFTCYTAYRLLYDDAPADYSEVYVYATDDALDEIKRRFKSSDKVPNVIILKCDSGLERMIKEHKLKRSSVCAAQIFVDLWNANQWYAKDFVDALLKRLVQ